MFAIHLASTLAMLGVILSVQAIQYPLFLKVGAEDFQTYHQSHMSRISFVVIPLMFLELGSAIALFVNQRQLDVSPFNISLLLLALIWASTFFIQVPLHQRLSDAPDEITKKRLVASNWIRTLAWSARSVILLSLLQSRLALL